VARQPRRTASHPCLAPSCPAADGNAWRNKLNYNPFAPASGYSYYDVVVSPIAEAMKEFWELKSNQVQVGCGRQALGDRAVPAPPPPAPARQPPAAPRPHRSLHRRPQLWFSLAGETGRSVFAYPKEWTTSLGSAKQQITRTRKHHSYNVKVRRGWQHSRAQRIQRREA
jgi:hypothetical protein